MTPQITRRPVVVITARVHPAETCASWMMEGLLALLLDPRDPAAAILTRPLCPSPHSPPILASLKHRSNHRTIYRSLNEYKVAFVVQTRRRRGQLPCQGPPTPYTGTSPRLPPSVSVWHSDTATVGKAPSVVLFPLGPPHVFIVPRARNTNKKMGGAYK